MEKANRASELIVVRGGSGPIKSSGLSLYQVFLQALEEVFAGSKSAYEEEGLSLRIDCQ